MHHFIVALSALGIIASLCYYQFATFTAWMFSRRTASEPAPLPKIPPRVAILKPLHGLSSTLPGNIVSYLELAYSRVEYIFGVASYEDRAIDVPVGLRAPYQFANITVVVGEEPGYSNRKVAKLIKMGERISDKTEILVLSDADVCVERDHLRRVVSELVEDEKTGIVTCIYRAKPDRSFTSRLAAMFVNTDFAPQVILAQALEPLHYALGATIAIKREALEKIGGFRAIGNLLADDFHLGRKVADAGYKIRLSSSIVTIAAEEKDFSHFWSHQLRWARTYRSVRPVSLFTLLLHGPFWALLYLILTGFSPLSMAALAAILLCRVTMGAVMLGKVLKLPELLADLWMIPIKDLIMTGIYFASLTGQTVHWGGRRFRLTTGGAMHELI